MNDGLAVIVPTRNEKDNILLLLEKIRSVLEDIDWEVIFVDDDSSDGTPEIIERAAADDPRIRLLRRFGRRGLSSACIEGFCATVKPLLAVMDADLQHDEALLPRMHECLASGECHLALGSRYLPEGSAGSMSPRRFRMSRAATVFGQYLLPPDRRVSDPLSGFFMMRRDFFLKTVSRLSGKGYKILLDCLASSPVSPRVREFPYTFRERTRGESKLDLLVIAEYFLLVCDKKTGGILPVRFVMFVCVGAVGVLLHLLVLGGAMRVFSFSFPAAQALAAWAAMTLNFTLNNLFTYRDRRLRKSAFWKGMVTFWGACAVGAFANVSTATALFGFNVPWPIAGALGAVIGAVWNFAVTRTFTWKDFRNP
jgi:dolichol-phosphate mannosyltransferase